LRKPGNLQDTVILYTVAASQIAQQLHSMVFVRFEILTVVLLCDVLLVNSS